jgi:hypothetical protein
MILYSNFGIGSWCRNQETGDPFIDYLPESRSIQRQNDHHHHGWCCSTGWAMLWRVGERIRDRQQRHYHAETRNLYLRLRGGAQNEFLRPIGAPSVTFNGLNPLSLQGLNATTNRTFAHERHETTALDSTVTRRNALPSACSTKARFTRIRYGPFELIPEVNLGLR